VFLRGRLGHQQEDQQADGLLVRRIEANGLGQLQHGGHRRLQALDAPMGNRHAMTQAGGAQALARKQAVGDERAIETVQVLEQQAHFLEGPFLLVASTCTSTCAAGRMDARRFMVFERADYAHKCPPWVSPSHPASFAEPGHKKAAGSAAASLPMRATQTREIAPYCIRRLAASWWWSCRRSL